MKAVKQIAKEILPAPIVEWKRRRAIQQLRRRNSQLTTQEVFARVYRLNEWGGEAGEFYSGSGSDSTVTASYCEMVTRFIAERGISKVVDLGCGDFRVGSQLQVKGVRYTGIDIVPELIDRNKRLYENDNTKFICLDVIRETPPDAELCLIRQVFQHLSNGQISKVLKKLGKYPYVLVTEHYPAGDLPLVPNLDKPHGGDVRLLDNSAVCLDQPPFNVTDITIVLEMRASDCLIKEGETIRTMLIDNTRSIDRA